jgi:hypothetical protein
VSDPPTSGRRAALVLAALALLVVAALLALGVYTWQSLGDVEMDANGYLALVLGVVGTVALGVGLMALLFYSNRHGYDDAAGGKKDKDS